MASFDEDNNMNDNQQKFVNILKRHSIILNRSQTLTIRDKKEIALKNIIKDIEGVFGERIVEKKVMKKINNMKTNVRYKTKIAQMTNTRIKLKTWEMELASLLKESSSIVDYNVPTESIRTIASNEIGKTTSPEEIGKSTLDEIGKSSSANIFTIDEQTETRDIKMERLEDFEDEMVAQGETQETNNMSNEELQRLILIEQLNLVREQRSLVNEKLNLLQMKQKQYKI